MSMEDPDPAPNDPARGMDLDLLRQMGRQPHVMISQNDLDR